MSNRRKTEGNRDERIANLAACADCTSSVTVGEQDPTWHLWFPRVSHDDSCPWLARFRETGVIPVIRVPMSELQDDRGHRDHPEGKSTP